MKCYNNPVYEDIIELTGEELGPTSMILVGVHGDEKCGIEAIQKILLSLKIQKGKVFIGYGNPRAIEQNVRFTESNLNRLFRPDDELSFEQKSSYEYSRAQFLKKYFDQADVLLDIHASHTLGSEGFVICENNAKDISKYLPFQKIVSGFDKIQPGGTDYYMNRMGKIGICIECGYVKDISSSEIAEKTILNFLKTQGNIIGELEIYPQSNLEINESYITKSTGFILAKNFEDFENVAASQIIGVDGNNEVKATNDGFIIFARNRNKMGEDAFLFGDIKRT